MIRIILARAASPSGATAATVSRFRRALDEVGQLRGFQSLRTTTRSGCCTEPGRKFPILCRKLSVTS